MAPLLPMEIFYQKCFPVRYSSFKNTLMNYSLKSALCKKPDKMTRISFSLTVSRKLQNSRITTKPNKSNIFTKTMLSFTLTQMLQILHCPLMTLQRRVGFLWLIHQYLQCFQNNKKVHSFIIPSIIPTWTTKKSTFFPVLLLKIKQSFVLNTWTKPVTGRPI